MMSSATHVPIAQASPDTLQMDDQDLSTPFLKGEVQPPEYRDTKFAYAFVAQIVGVLATAIIYAPSITNFSTDDQENMPQENADEDTIGMDNSFLLTILTTSLLAAILTNMALFTVMAKYPNAVIEISLWTAPVLLAIVGLVMFLFDPHHPVGLLIVAGIFGAFSAILYLCYSRFIPFAASTMKAALAVLRYRQGLYLAAFMGTVISFLCSGMFLVAFSGIVVAAQAKGTVSCQELYDDPNGDIYSSDEMCLKSPPSPFFLSLLFLALFWTQQVIQNVIHCTTAGTVGTWWFSGLGDPSWCSQDIHQALGRATTYSFGSICFGSLLVAILQTLQNIAHAARRNRRGALLACIIECILSCLRAYLEYFNSWAFCYVGLYGYDYLTAGKNVVQLFQNQGWGAFVSDRLIFRVLYASQLTIALMSGAAAVFVEIVMKKPDLDEEIAQAWSFTSFLIGFLVGLSLSWCSLFVMESAVRTIIVCFAESPAEFQEHHHELCQEMRQGWSSAYPDVWDEQYDLRFAEVIYTTSSDDSLEEKKGLTVV